jgi:hypothetical protein
MRQGCSLRFVVSYRPHHFTICKQKLLPDTPLLIYKDCLVIVKWHTIVIAITNDTIISFVPQVSTRKISLKKNSYLNTNTFWWLIPGNPQLHQNTVRVIVISWIYSMIIMIMIIYDSLISFQEWYRC